MASDRHIVGPFELLLLGQSLSKLRFEGVLHLRDEAASRDVRLFFVAGSPMYCRTDDIVYSFPAHALRYQLLPPDQLRELIREAERTEALLDNLLVSRQHLSSDDVLRAKSDLSTNVFETTMTAPALEYRAEWTPTALTSKTVKPLDPWDVFFGAVASDANGGFQREYVKARQTRPLKASPTLHPMLSRFEAAFGTISRKVLRGVADGASGQSILESQGHVDAVLRALFALMFSRLVSCRGLIEAPVDYPQIASPRAASTRSGPQTHPEQAGPRDAEGAPSASVRAAPPAATPAVAADSRPTSRPASARTGQGDHHDSPLAREAKAAEAFGRDVAQGATFDLASGRVQTTSGAGVAPPAAPRAGSDEPPSGAGSELPEHGDESIESILAETLERLLRSNAYKALDSSKDASFSELRECHQRLRRKHAASQYQSFVLGRRGFRLLAQIRKRLDDALRTLTEPRRRCAHDKKLGIGDGRLSPDLRNAFQAEASFNAGLKHLKEEDWDSAILGFQAAIERNPRDAAYHAYNAWALFQAHERGSIADPDAPTRALRQLEHALTLSPRLGAANLFRARLAAQMGDLETAAESYQRVLATFPNHEEARRELPKLRSQTQHRRKKDKSRGPLGFFKRATRR